MSFKCIHDLDDSFPTEFNNLKISLPENKYVFTRHLNMECFESAVPANIVSYAPTFFGNAPAQDP